MSNGLTLLKVSCLALLLVGLGWSSVTPATAQGTANPEKKVAGILIDKNKDWLTLKADGEDEEVKYVIDTANKKLEKALKNIFNAARVQLTYKKDGDSRQLVTIKRQILKANGIVTGTVVKLYNNFWIEVKPKTGLANAYAPGGNYNDKAFMEKLRALQPGDSVTLKFTTDGERHRIVWLRKNTSGAK